MSSEKLLLILLHKQQIDCQSRCHCGGNLMVRKPNQCEFDAIIISDNFLRLVETIQIIQKVLPHDRTNQPNAHSVVGAAALVKTLSFSMIHL